LERWTNKADVERIVARTVQGMRSKLLVEGGTRGESAGPEEEDADWGGKRGGQGPEFDLVDALRGDVVELELAVQSLRGDARARSMKDRLMWYLEESTQGLHLQSECPETVLMLPRGLFITPIGSAFFVLSFIVPLLAVWSRRFTAPLHDSDIVFAATASFQVVTTLSVPHVVYLLRIPPPHGYKAWAVWAFCVCVLDCVVVWLVQGLYFRDENSIPPTLLRHARYPVMLTYYALMCYLVTFSRQNIFLLCHTLPQVLPLAVISAAFFLGEDPDSSAMGFFFLALMLGPLLTSARKLSKMRVAKRQALRLVAPVRDRFEAAWKLVVAGEGGEAAAAALSGGCREVSLACEEEVKAFEASVSQFSLKVPLPNVFRPYREGPFTRRGKPRQAEQDCDILVKQARLLNPHFQDWVPSWAGWGNGAKYVPGPVKHARRVIEKCVRAYARDAAAVTDLVRCTIVYPSLQGVLDFFVAVKERSDMGGVGMLRIRRVKNRLDMGYSDPTGYRDLSILVEVGWVESGCTIEFLPVKDWGRGTSRHICEIQVFVSALYEVKEREAHDTYCTYRDIMNH